ncbi:acyl carrier protein [uncultured Thiohalocapsa sp.]|uniref:acyl carrier protein n=1 Tax=uncultured Thiohalocapsa sp. TaxID=768990 RepID=UPI0025F3EF47|nr:acyl carrier protein [uncultured Thiohalocapsa sp.]
MDYLSKDIRAFIEENFLFGGSAEDISDDGSLIAEGILDSAGVLELVAFLEGTYGIQVADSELLPTNLDSINRIAHYVVRKQACLQAARVA